MLFSLILLLLITVKERIILTQTKHFVNTAWLRAKEKKKAQPQGSDLFLCM
jgi:hypothetical protein